MNHCSVFVFSIFIGIAELSPQFTMSDDQMTTERDHINENKSTNVGDYEQVECDTRTKWITPKGLNNIYNKFITLDTRVVQKIQMTECINKGNCGPSTNETTSKCHQHYTKIQLKAMDANFRSYDKSFYYPSACDCVVFKKRSDF